MLVQWRKDGTLWCFTQHDHAKLSGVLAHEWCGLEETPSTLSWEVVLGTTFHDWPWHKEDLTPKWNPETQSPYSFLDFPTRERLTLYKEGLDALEAIDLHATLLVSLHYCGFKGLKGIEAFQEAEARRQQRLLERMGESAPSMEQLKQELPYVQLFDLLSLAVCLKAPSAVEEACPLWLLPKNVAYTPAGRPFQMQWDGDSRVICDPFPWRRPLTLTIPYRLLETSSYVSEASLLEAWNRAPTQIWTLEWVGA
ncbi:MAG: DUF3891 family protein [Deltaproteobacteria bacterium]|nr:MAG: DUF3891 family protein [Deltaproteobacteria bacterium]